MQPYFLSTLFSNFSLSTVILPGICFHCHICYSLINNFKNKENKFTGTSLLKWQNTITVTDSFILDTRLENNEEKEIYRCVLLICLFSGKCQKYHSKITFVCSCDVQRKTSITECILWLRIMKNLTIHISLRIYTSIFDTWLKSNGQYQLQHYLV